jgi:hypothetical protein
LILLKVSLSLFLDLMLSMVVVGGGGRVCFNFFD